MEGSAHQVRGQGDPSYMPGVDPGRHGGMTYTAQATEPTIDDYANIFGPSARDIKSDLQKYKRHGRWHLPDALKGPNQWLTDRVDGLITDATNSPFTTRILPYKYIPNPDGKFKWNVWSFDEGMASRVPYESAARTLTQTKRSFAGYTVRQGLAIALEHNFMMSDKGRENFKNQLQQLVGSIQYTNDLDVHIALILAPSYESTLRDRYYIEDKTPTQVCREYVDLFGFIQKNQNALDIIIEEGKARLKSWGGPMPDFLLCNSKLTFQLTMTPERTNYLTQGIDGVKRLRAGPDLSSYRGLNIIHSRCFSMDPGTQPRDILRRRVRVAEYYRILPHKDNYKREFQFYNEERDTWFTYSFKDLLNMAKYAPNRAAGGGGGPGGNNHQLIDNVILNLNGLHAEAGPADHNAHQLAAMAIHDDDEGTGRLGSHMNLAPARLGLEIDATNPASVRQLCAQVVVAAMDNTWANWSPKGEFIAPNLVFAMGAMNWNEFWVTRNNNRNTRRYIAPTNPVPGGGGAAALGAPALGQVQYIPPEKYYFRVNNANNDPEMQFSGLPYGINKCIEYRNALISSRNADITEAGNLINDPYAGCLAGNLMYDPAQMGNQQYLEALSLQEQLKVSAALLFQAVCEYPRSIRAFYGNEAAERFLTSAEYLTNDYTNFGIPLDDNFAESIRFRNYMRYGVAKGLLTENLYVNGPRGVRFGQAVGGRNVNYADYTFTTGSASCNVGGVTTILPWNKIAPQNNVDRQLVNNPKNAPEHYSAFDVTRGARSYNVDNNIPGIVVGAGAGVPPIAPATDYQSDTIFFTSKDDGKAYLREFGAFLSPNHFHSQNDQFIYKTVGSFLGAHVIITKEMVSSFLMRTRANNRDQTTTFFEDTLLHTLLTSRSTMTDDEVNEIHRFMELAWNDCYTTPENALRAYRANPAGAPAAPPGSIFNRLDLTSRFTSLDANNINLSTILGRIARRLQMTNQHHHVNAVWTWPHVSDTDSDLWVQAVTDFRLQFGGGNAVPVPGIAAPPAAPAQINQQYIDAYFPEHQVGNYGVSNWAAQLNDYATSAGTQAPNGNTQALRTAYKNNWAFSKIITARPERDTFQRRRDEVLAFLYQIFTRFVYDQSDEPVVHSETDQFDTIPGPLPCDPTALPRHREPFYAGMPGGMFNRRFPQLAPDIPDGGMRQGPGSRWGPGGPGGGGGGGGGGGPGGPRNNRLGQAVRDSANIELVIVRPNIEHQMLGIIMGKGGEELGNTLWGQTELSCYDDSMHGIWGMSYKYHERAIVFNEKNLIRLWDVAYDGYSGGKDATYVEWDRPEKVDQFKSATNDISQNYKGPSMMVLAFSHNPASPDYRDNFRRNWPSPIVFHDDHDYNLPGGGRRETAARLAADPNNSHPIDTRDMRVFNNPLYGAYAHYYDLMPNFSSLHQVRKPAGASAHENETFCDSLAFQGTMKINEDGREVEHIQGSGHHGPDWVGVASIRSGKGYKIASQPGLARLV